MSARNEIEGTELKILVLEDSPLDLELIREQLSEAGYILDMVHVENERDYTTELREHRYDIILSDFSLPGFDAFGALQISNELCPDVPFICISGSIGEETAIELLKMGANDYVLKDRPERLPFAVKRALDEVVAISAHKSAARALLESEYRFKQVADNALEWIWEVDKDGLFTYSSTVVFSLLGYTANEVVGKKYFYDFFPPEQKDRLMLEAFQHFTRSESFRNFENPNVHKSGNIIMLTTSGSPVFDDQGNLAGYRGVDADITERHRMLEELVKAKEKAEESDKLKTAFINNISHEIRTPLNSIMGFGPFLLESDPESDEWKRYYTIVEKSGYRLMNTVNDYVDMARIVSGTMEVKNSEFIVNSLFQEVIEKIKDQCAEKKLIFDSEIPVNSETVQLSSDREFIRKTFNILLDNALKFTHQGKITSGYRMLPGFLEFFVNDTGIGIAADKLDLIFDMFSQEYTSDTRGYEGSGLGLSIAHGLVKLLGGKLKVSSEKGTGSVFSFTVPYHNTSTAETIDLVKPAESTTNKGKLVLVADDEESNYCYMEVLLHRIGFQCIAATTGAEAVDLCRQHSEIALVLMDIKMPVMNGLEATRIIHDFRPQLPIVAVTAYAQTGDEQRFLAGGCNGYLPKPVKKESLLRIVSDLNLAD